MSLLNHKKVLIAITGGIAAYKIPFLVRLFVKENAQVKVILTEKAKDFVTPLTLSTVSNRPVEYLFKKEDDSWNNHVELGLWADYIIVAPATANTIAKMANGVCDNLVLAVYFSAKCKIFVAPAMDLDMYIHPTTIKNLQTLEKNGNYIIPSEKGELASGLYGEGRMAEPENILKFVKDKIEANAPLLGKKVLISAGPTYEYIDPVRFIGNFSSGKMGYNLAKEASRLGAEVILVSGTSSEETNNYKNIKLHKVVTTKEMHDEMWKHYVGADIVIMAAAVADYKVKNVSLEKIKKKDSNDFNIELEKNIDILNSFGENKKNQILVGFALETSNEEEYALEKLKRKNLDLVVLNSLNDKDAGFGTDNNKITIFTKKEKKIEFDNKSKLEVSKDILNEIIKLLEK